MKRIVCALFTALFFLYNGSALGAARSAILVESETGRVLYAQNADEALPMASTTKVMTALLALENAALSDRVTAGRNAFGVPGTSIYLTEGETLTMEQMLYGLMLSSGNDAAVAIAEHVDGSVDAFCAHMTRRARELGCENTVFLTPHGLPKNGHYTTARDLVTIARAAMAHETFRRIVSTTKANIPWAGRDFDRVLTNKNKLLSTYPGATGVKTGYTAAAGRCLVFSAERDGLSLLGAVLNCPDWFDVSAAILDEGFAAWRMVTALEQGEIVCEKAVSGGAKDTFSVAAARAVKAPMRLGEWPELTVELDPDVAAPLYRGDEVGRVTLSDRGETLLTVPLVAAEDVLTATFRTQLRRIGQGWLAAE